jgi:hypothetical protein
MMATPSSALPTLPYFPRVGDRRALLAGITFIEDTASGRMSIRELRDWFDRHVVVPGVMPRPVMVNEPVAGSVPLHPSGASAALAEQGVQRLLFAARSRVVSALRGLISQPVDDRFLAGAIFAGRVRRRRVIETSQWVSHPEPTAPLSGIVLSLFAVDVLSNREEYDRQLCVCDVCGRVSFQDVPVTRRHCSEHPAHVSGFTRAVSPDRRFGAGEEP